MSYVLTLVLAAFTVVQPGVLLPALLAARPFFLIALLALGAWLLGPKSRSPIPFRPAQHWLVLGFVAAQGISVLQFLYIPQFLEITLEWIKIALVYLLVASQINSHKRLLAFWSVMALSVAWAAAQAAWVYHGQPLTHPQLSGGRLSGYGAYSGANDLALLMVCTWPIVFKLIDIVKNPFLRLLPLPALLLMAYVDIRTISRAGMLGMALVMGLSMLRGRRLGKLGRWALLVPAVVVLLMIGSQVLLTRGDAQDFRGEDESVQNRFDAWYAGWQMFKSSPLIGVGSGEFASSVRRFGLSRAIQAHNTIIKVMAETGLIGLGCYLGFLAVTFRALWRIWRRSRLIDPNGPSVLWAEALGIALIGFFFNTLFSVKAHEWLLYMIVASAVSLERLVLEDTVKLVLASRLGMTRSEAPEPAGS